MAIGKGVSEGQPLVGREGFVGVGERVLGYWTYLCWGESPWALAAEVKVLGLWIHPCWRESPWALVLKKDFGRKFTCVGGIPILSIKTVPRGDSPVVGLCSFYIK